MWEALAQGCWCKQHGCSSFPLIQAVLWRKKRAEGRGMHTTVFRSWLCPQVLDMALGKSLRFLFFFPLKSSPLSFLKQTLSSQDDSRTSCCRSPKVNQGFLLEAWFLEAFPSTALVAPPCPRYARPQLPAPGAGELLGLSASCGRGAGCFHLPEMLVFPGSGVLQAKQEVKEYWLMLPACIFNACAGKPSENGKGFACSKAFYQGP